MANGNGTSQLPDIGLQQQSQLPDIGLSTSQLPDIGLGQTEEERNPFFTFGKKFWSTLRHQIPSAIMGAGSNVTGITEDVMGTVAPEAFEASRSIANKGLSDQARNDLDIASRMLGKYQKALSEGRLTEAQFMELALEPLEKIAFIQGEKFDTPRPSYVEAVQGSMLEIAQDFQDQGAEFTADLTNTIKEIEDPIDAANWAFGAVGQAAAQIPMAVATGGFSSVTQETGAIYMESVMQKAEQLGVTPAEVIAMGEDDTSTSLAFGIVAGSLDRIGAGKVLDSFSRDQFKKSLRDRALASFTSGGVESVTEGTQTIIEQVGVDLGSDSSIDLHKDDIIEAMAQGLVGGTGLAAVGETVGAIQDARSEERVVDGGASLEDVERVATTGDSEVDAASREAIDQIEDTINEVKRDDSDQQVQPDRDTEEGVRVGGQTEPDGQGVSGAVDITGVPQFTEPEGFTPQTVIELDEETRMITPELDFQAEESINNYAGIENLKQEKEPKTSIGKAIHGFTSNAKDLIDQFSSNFENYIGELTESNPKLREQLGHDFRAPIYNVLRNKLVDENKAASVIRDYRNKDVDPFKMWAYSFLQENDGTSPEFKVNEMRKSAKNKGDKKEIEALERFLAEYSEKGDAVMTQDELGYYAAFREIVNERAQTRAQVSDEIFGKPLTLHENYVPHVVVGRTKRSEVNKDIDGMEKALDEKQFFERIGTQLRSPASSPFQERKGVGDAYYNTNFNEVFSKGIRDLATDVHLAPAIYKMKQILKSPELEQTIGIENVQEFQQRLQYFINNVKGFNRPGNLFEKISRKAIGNIKGAMLSDPGQLFKQFVPGLVGLFSVYGLKPGAIARGMKMYFQASNDWIRENAPELYVRQQSMDHLIESSLVKAKGERVSARAAINTWLNVSDFAISKLLFLTEYASRGGTIENTDSKALNEAAIAQARAQSTNTLATAPRQFVNQNILLQYLMPFTMMPLNISRQIFRNLDPTKLGNSDRRKMLAFGVANIVVFQAVSQLVIEGYDEIADALWGEDEEDERYDADSADGLAKLLSDEEMYKKVAIKSAMDAAIGWAPEPISAIANQYAFDPVRQGWMNEDDVEDPSLQIYYGGGDHWLDGLGVVGSWIDDAHKATQAMAVAIESEDEEAYRYAMAYLMEVNATIGSRAFTKLGPSFGPFIRGVKEYKKSLKESFKEAKAEVKKAKKDKESAKKRRFNVIE